MSSCIQKKNLVLTAAGPILALGLLFTISTLIACAGGVETKSAPSLSATTTTASSTPGTTPTTPTTGAGAASGMWMKVTTGQKGNFYEHLLGDYNTPCKIDSLSSASVDLKCVIDVPEEDLFYWGMKFTWNVPPSMCTYAIFRPYYFENWQVAYGPSSITYYVDASGAIGSAGGAGTVSGGLPAGLGSDGTPLCAYNYTSQLGPNCCLGEYFITKNVYTAGAWVATTTKGAWGGKASTCMAGPAMDTQTKTKDGFPTSDIYAVEGVGVQSTYSPPTPLSKLTFASVLLANYYTTQPTALSSAIVSPTESYQVLCLDPAGEVKARIRLYIQDWNQYSEWQSKGNPNTIGVEPIEGNINDSYDWDNYEALTGSAKYPRLIF